MSAVRAQRPLRERVTPDGALRLATWFVVALFALCLLIALVVPYHATDALVYGTWSRAIAGNGHYFQDVVGYPPFSRPLFYAPQGYIWWLVGSHEWIGRLISLAFFALLVWAVVALLRELRTPPAAPVLGAVLLLAIPDVVFQAFAGQTDVPVAALVATCGVLAFRRRPTRTTAILLVMAATAAVLAKATALPALAGLGLAVLIGPRAGVRERLLHGLLPLALGTALGLLHGVIMARHFGLALNEFLGGITAAGPGSTDAVGRVGGAVSSLTSEPSRMDILLRAGWLGPYLRLLIIFSVLYALLRVVGVRHLLAVLAALGAGLVAFWAGPTLFPHGGGEAVRGAGAIAASFLLVAPLLAAGWCPPELVPSRLLMARLLCWSVPPLLAWATFGILADTRTLSPAWPALAALMAVVAATAIAGVATRSALAAAAAVVLLLGLAVLDLRNLDGLGTRPDGSNNSVRALRHLPPSAWFDPERARTAADPQLGGLLGAARAATPRGERLITNDGRMTFFFRDRVQVGGIPDSCAGLRGYGAVALLTHVFTQAEFDRLDRLKGCLRETASVPGSYAVFRVV